MTSRRRRALLGALAITAFVGAACGDDTATSGNATTTTGGGAEGFSVETTVTTADGETLSAVHAGGFNGAVPGVVLGHMRGTGKETWVPFAETLAEAGYQALALDFRGYGDSSGERDTSLDVDLAAAVDHLSAAGATEIVVVGASMGGTAAVVLAVEADLAGVVSLSGPATFAGLDAATAAGGVDEPLLAVVATGDTAYVEANEGFAADAPQGRLVTFDGSAHGTNLFDTHGPELTALLLDLLPPTS